jgi:hypothetical protein
MAKAKLELIVMDKVFKYEGLEKNKERDLWELLIRKSITAEKVPEIFRQNKIEGFEALSDQDIIGRFNAHVEAKAAKKGGTAAAPAAPAPAPPAAPAEVVPAPPVATSNDRKPSPARPAPVEAPPPVTTPSVPAPPPPPPPVPVPQPEPKPIVQPPPAVKEVPTPQPTPKPALSPRRESVPAATKPAPDHNVAQPPAEARQPLPPSTTTKIVAPPQAEAEARANPPAAAPIQPAPTLPASTTTTIPVPPQAAEQQSKAEPEVKKAEPEEPKPAGKRTTRRKMNHDNAGEGGAPNQEEKPRAAPEVPISQVVPPPPVQTAPPPRSPASSPPPEKKPHTPISEAAAKKLSSKTADLLTRFFAEDKRKVGTLSRDQLVEVLRGADATLTDEDLDSVVNSTSVNSYGGYDYVALVGVLATAKPRSSSTASSPASPSGGKGAAAAEAKPPVPAAKPPVALMEEVKRIKSDHRDPNGPATSSPGGAAATTNSGTASAADLQRSSSSNAMLRESSSAAFQEGSGKLQIFIQLEGTDSNKLVMLSPGFTFEELQSSADRKFGLANGVALFFTEGEDRIALEDEDSVEVLHQLCDGKTRFKLLAKPKSGLQKGNGAAPPTTSAVPPQGVDKKKIPPGPKSLPPAPSAVVGAVTAAVGGLAATAGGLLGSGSVAIQPPSPSSVVVKLAGPRPTPPIKFQMAAPVFSVSLSPRADRFVCASRDKSVTVWDVANQVMITQLAGGHRGMALSCDFSPDGSSIVSSSESGEVKLWSPENGKTTNELKGHKDKVFCAKFSYDGRMVITSSNDKTVRVWYEGKKCQVLLGHTDAVFCCCFGRNQEGRFVASGGADTQVKVWDWRGGKEVLSLLGHQEAIWSVNFSNDDSKLVSAAMSRDIIIWDLKTAQILRLLQGHLEPVHEAIFSPCGQFVVSCSRDWCIMVWDVSTGKRIETLSGHRHTVYHISLVGNKLASCSFDESVRIWNLNLQVA